MRRSLRKIDSQELSHYAEADQLFTVTSLDEARQRLGEAGLQPADHCFFTWMRNGVRYYRVWEDLRLKQGLVAEVPFGETAARLKRAEAEKLYTLAKRYVGEMVQLQYEAGLLEVIDKRSGEVKVAISLPQVGGGLIFQPGAWTPGQAASFVNALLVRGQHPDLAFLEAEGLLVANP